jgi:hypothetical protein
MKIVYIGSTSMPLCRRKASHYEDFKNPNKKVSYSHIGDKLGGNIRRLKLWKIILKINLLEGKEKNFIYNNNQKINC